MFDETHDSEPSYMNLQPTPSVVNPKRVACTEVVTSTTSTTESDSDSTVIHKLKRKLQVEVKAHERYIAHHHQVAPKKTRRQPPLQRWPSSSDESYDEIYDTQFDLTIDQVYKDLANSSDDVSDTDGHNESKTPTDVSDPDNKKDDGTKKDTTTHPLNQDPKKDDDAEDENMPENLDQDNDHEDDTERDIAAKDSAKA